MNPPDGPIPLDIATDHPAFAGHFPGRPILPGIALLGEVYAALARSVAFEPTRFTLSSAKFLSPVTPGEALVLHHRQAQGGVIRFEVHGANGLAANGILTPRSGAAAT